MSENPDDRSCTKCGWIESKKKFLDELEEDRLRGRKMSENSDDRPCTKCGWIENKKKFLDELEGE